MAEVTYPLSRTKFRVEIDGMQDLVGWVRVEGLQYGTKSEEMYTDHTNKPRNLPGKAVAGPIRLERMFDADDRLAKWASQQAKDTRNGSVIFLDYTGKESRRFNWSSGWISLYQITEFDAAPESEGPAREIIVITVEDIFPG